MPELPEVQTTVAGLITHMKGCVINNVWTDYNSTFHKGKDTIKNPLYFKKFKNLVVGQKVTNIERRAKNILIHLNNKHTILIHMKMTGHVLYGTYIFNPEQNVWKAKDKGPLQDPFNRFIHLVFTLSNKKHVVLSDMRKFAKVTMLETPNIFNAKELRKLGPEPLSPSLTIEAFYKQLQTKPQGRIKTVLMDQEVVAGIGNIYSDEILWHAGVHPEKRVKSLTHKEIKNIFEGTKSILQKSLKLGGDSMSDYRNISGEKGGFQLHHTAYRQHGKKCTKQNCNGTICRIKVGGRSAHFCAEHQKMA